MAKVKESFMAVRPGEVYPTVIAAGEEVDGRLEEIAKYLGKLAGKAKGTAPENKAAK